MWPPVIRPIIISLGHHSEEAEMKTARECGGSKYLSISGGEEIILGSASNIGVKYRLTGCYNFDTNLCSGYCLSQKCRVGHVKRSTGWKVVKEQFLIIYHMSSTKCKFLNRFLMCQKENALVGASLQVCMDRCPSMSELESTIP